MDGHRRLSQSHGDEARDFMSQNPQKQGVLQAFLAVHSVGLEPQ